MDRLREPKGRFGRWAQDHQQLLKQIGIGLGFFVVLIVLFQLLYPSNRTLPGVKVSGENVGGKSLVDAQKILDKNYEKASLTVKTEDKSFTRPLDEVGVNMETKPSLKEAARYPVWQRFIPFSSFFIMADRNTPLGVSFDDDRLKYFAQEVHKDGFVQSVNASVAIKGSEVELVPSKPSKDYPVDEITKAVRKATFEPRTTVQLTAKKKAAERTNDEVKSLLAEAQKAVDTPLALSVQGAKTTVEKATIAGWLDFKEDPATMKLQLALKQDVVTKYLDTAQKKVYKAPGTTVVRLVDGIEVDRTVGTSGRGVDVPKTITLIDQTLRKGQSATLEVPLVELPPKITYTRSYSQTDAGLRALLADLSSKGFGISVREIGGSGRSGSTNGSKAFTAASTYKLFVAYAVFKEIEAGRMSWGDSINGKSAGECFDIMIVRSDNPCAKAFGEKLGWQNIENQMRGLGLGSTRLNTGNMATTANDLTVFLAKLQSGSLLSANDQGKLLDLMKRQIYRAGIPAGTGLMTANKPGFVDSVIHDAGIVYGPKGPYALTIMTSNSSWGAIADVARQINAYLNG